MNTESTPIGTGEEIKGEADIIETAKAWTPPTPAPIHLSNPIAYGDTVIGTLHFRRPMAGELFGIPLLPFYQLEIDAILKTAARASSVPITVEQLSTLSAPDLLKVVNGIQDVMAGPEDHKYDGTLLVPLKLPSGKVLEKIKMRQPTAGDLRGIKLTRLMELDTEALLTVVSRLSHKSIPEGALHGMDGADLFHLSQEVSGFFAD